MKFKNKEYSKEDIVDLLAGTLAREDFPGFDANKDKLQKWLGSKNDDVKYFLTNLFYYTGVEIASGSKFIKCEKVH